MNTCNLIVKGVEEDRRTKKLILLLEPSDRTRLEDYHYDIRLLQKDFDVDEIDEDLHFVYSDQIKDFFERHGDLTQSLRFINEAMA